MTLPSRMGRMTALLFLGLASALAAVALAGCGGASSETSVAEPSNSDGANVREEAGPQGSGAWRSVPLKEKVAGEFASVACPAVGDCWATANLEPGGGQIFHFDGQEWQRTPTPTEALTLYGIACPSRADCWAVGAVASGDQSISTLIEHYDGKEWTVEESPDADGLPESGLMGIVCPSEAECWAAGNGQDFGQEPTRGELLLLRRADDSWSRVEAPSPEEEELTGDGPLLACGSPSRCMLLTNFGAQGGTTNEQSGDIFEGDGWRALALPPGIFFQALSCPGPDECIALGGPEYDGAMSAYRYAGKAWSAPEPLPAAAGEGVASWYSLSCPSSSECWAAGGQPITGAATPAVVTRLHDGGWSVPAQLGAAGELTAISCVAADSCLTVGGASASPNSPEPEPLALALSP